MTWGTAVLMLATGILLPTSDVYSDLFFLEWLFHGNYFVNTYEDTNEYYYDSIRYRWFPKKVKVSCKDRGIVVPPHPKFGTVMSIPLLLSWLLVIRQWYKMEHGMKQKLKTLPLLILQVYPQWRALRVLYHAKWRKNRGWPKMKEEWETGITHIGKHQMRS